MERGAAQQKECSAAERGWKMSTCRSSLGKYNYSNMLSCWRERFGERESCGICTPTPVSCVNTGIIGIRGEPPGGAGMIGVSAGARKERRLTAETQRAQRLTERKGLGRERIAGGMRNQSWRGGWPLRGRGTEEAG